MEDRIERFDQYITGKLTEPESAAFERSLDSDTELAAEFSAYLLAVRGICQEAVQENIEFGHAIKSMSKQHLMELIGKRETRHIARPRHWRERVAWACSMAAMLVIVLAIGWNMQISNSNHLCDVVYNLSYKPMTVDRGLGKENLDLNNMTSEQIESEIPEMRATFESDEIDSQDWHIDGKNLAMAYLKLHHKDKAVEVLEVLADKSSEPQPYILLIKQLQ